MIKPQLSICLEMMTIPTLRYAAKIVSLAAFSVLVGCGTVVVGDPLLPANAKLSPVVVSITSNTGEIRGFDQITLTKILPPRKDGLREEETFILNQVVPGMARDTSLFIGSLPPGDYSFTSMVATPVKKRLALNEKMLGKFTVHPGKSVDLGRLLLTPVNTKVIVGRVNRLSSNVALLERFSAPHAPLFSGAVDAGWNAPDADADVREEYARRRPVGAECATELPNGGVVTASRLGSVLMRSPEGRWRVVRGPGIESLLCVTPVAMPGAELLAVGEFGTLLRKPPGVDQLIPVDTGNLPPGNLINIAGTPEYGWIVAHQTVAGVTLFHSPTLEAGTWTVLRKEERVINPMFNSHAFWMWNTKGGMAYATYTGPIHFLDFATNKWTERTTPNNAKIIALNSSPAGDMGLLTASPSGLAGLFASVYRSKNQATSWEEIKAPFKVKMWPPLHLADGSMLMAGGMFGGAEIQISKDEGKSWVHLSKYEHGRILLPLKSGDILDFDLGQYGIFNIRHTSDGGKTWQSEYSNFDRRAYDAEKK
jgi:hypothetical protein